MELLLNACSTYAKKRSLPGKQKHDVYSTEFTVSDPDRVDKDISDILVTHLQPIDLEIEYPGTNGISYNKKREIPGVWKAPTRQSQWESKTVSSSLSCQHAWGWSVVDLDSVIDYAVMKHDTAPVNTNDDMIADNKGTALMAYMSGQKSSCGDHVRPGLASNQQPDKNKNIQKRQANESNSVPSSVTIDGMTYYLNKGESINFQGHNYTANMTEFHYRVGQHDVADMEHALVDHGANGGICGIFLEVSQHFVDAVGLAGQKVNQMQIVTA
jgi:hypothetical protein